MLWTVRVRRLTFLEGVGVILTFVAVIVVWKVLIQISVFTKRETPGSGL
jgi:hypothetical protein